MTERYDIIIAGGGMVGASLARALAPLGLRVAVVEPVEPGAAAQPSFDDRSTALSRASQRAFTAMGLWPAIAAAATPIRAIHVSDRGSFGFCRIEAEEQGVEALGYVVVNRVLGQTLLASLAQEGGPQLYRPARITAVTQTEESVTATVAWGDGHDGGDGDGDGDGEERLEAALLVAADGARSAVRAAVGIGMRERPYGQVAITGNLATSRPHDNVAYERFTKDGPVALLPFTEGRSAFVWTLPPAEAERVTALDDDAFLAEFQAVFGWRLGRLSRVGRRVAYPLALTRAEHLHAGRVVAIGNAAHGLHPVAGQGYNLGMRDVAALADLVAEAIAEGGDPGSPALLARYADWRRGDQRKVVGFTDGLVRLFGSELETARAARGIGMLGLDIIPGAKRAFARHTMGLAGRLPRLSRGVPLR
ncbi:2-octaprenyl-6-methoxyphenyl hydroxylase [Lentisalinibacter orientalis]|uniref:2-octaprenyl-6-methoxyphenyl hydroxylase n=1 Tax=Lentisalinibacter orientalis TaxID=2992241 RepID=UPI0038651230